MSSRTLRARVASAVSEVIGEAESGILVLLDLLEKDLGKAAAYRGSQSETYHYHCSLFCRPRDGPMTHRQLGDLHDSQKPCSLHFLPVVVS